jgi:hypothetical protein
MRSLARQPGPVIVWRAQLAGPRPGQLVEEVRRALSAAHRSGGGGSAVPWRRWIFCHEPGPGQGRQAWVIRGAGLLTKLESLSAPRGAAAARELEQRGWLIPPTPGVDARTLERAHAELFPGGFTLHIGRKPPAVFVALAAEVRQAIWRDAIRRTTAGRRRASAASEHWSVHVFAPAGELTQVFVAPRAPRAKEPAATPLPSPRDRAWAHLLQQATWQTPTSNAGDDEPASAERDARPPSLASA